MKKIITVCFFFISAGSSFAQPVTFQKMYGGANGNHGLSVCQTNDEGYVSVGTIKTSTSTFDVYLIKTDSSGILQWSKTYGANDIDYGYSVQQTTDGGYIVAGNSADSGGIQSYIYLIKTDANGDTLWTKTIGGAGISRGYSVEQTVDGGYIITGSTESFGAGDADMFLLKTDNSGNVLWLKTFGGAYFEEGFSVQQTSDGGYIIAGTTSIFPAGYVDIYLVKTDTSGNILWSKTFGGIGEDRSYSVQQTSDGGYNTHWFHRKFWGGR